MLRFTHSLDSITIFSISRNYIQITAAAVNIILFLKNNATIFKAKNNNNKLHHIVYSILLNRKYYITSSHQDEPYTFHVVKVLLQILSVINWFQKKIQHTVVSIYCTVL